MKTKVIVLGSTGMLGSMVSGYLSRNPDLDVLPYTRAELDAEQFTLGAAPAPSLDSAYLINCIGIIKPYCKDNDPVGVRRAIAVNGLFPHRLAEAAKVTGAKVIQIATDCVYSGRDGKYMEDAPHDALDVYGKSKSLGEVFDGGLLNIRCSIIGPELKGKLSLLEWFLGNPPGSLLKGFTHHHWNGVTTLQFAQLCEAIITNSAYESLLSIAHCHHFVPNTTVDKYQLLQLMQEVFGTNHTIQPVGDIGPPVDRTIATKYPLLATLAPSREMRGALADLKTYLDGVAH